MLWESHKLLMTSLTTWYSAHPEHKDSLKEVVNGASKISLRILDWFVTHYAKKNQIVYFIDDTKNRYSANTANVSMRKFNVYLEYRAQLQSYTKLFFDSFRRHERITFVLDPSTMDTIETTVGQLNFFRWACRNHVIQYIYDNISAIEEAMAEYQKTIKLVDTKPVSYVTPPSTTINGSIYVTFD